MIRRLVHLLTLALLAGCSLLPPDSATRTPTAPVLTIAPPQTALIPTATDSPTPSRTPTRLPTSTTIPSITPLPFLPTDCPTLTPTPTGTATPLVSPIPSATNTGTPTNTPTSTATRTTTPDPSASPTPSATTGPTRTPTTTSTPTITPTPTASITWTPHPCPSPTPTSTLTPTPSHTPTPTPVLPELAGLAIDSSVLEAVDPGFWTDPPEDLTPDLKGAGTQCIVDCLGFRWESADSSAMLTMLIYRTPDFRDAVASGLASQTYYLGRSFETFTVPPIGNLPAFTWIGVLLEKDVVLITSQGPAVIIFFWQNDGQIDVDSVVDSITRYAGVQSEILREHGFLTISLQLTPFP